MKVKELIQRLSQFDGELDVLCYTEEGDILPADHLFRLLEINGVSVAEGEKCRGDDQVPSLKFGQSPHGHGYVLIDITSDF